MAWGYWTTYNLGGENSRRVRQYAPPTVSREASWDRDSRTSFAMLAREKSATDTVRNNRLCDKMAYERQLLLGDPDWSSRTIADRNTLPRKRTVPEYDKASTPTTSPPPPMAPFSYGTASRSGNESESRKSDDVFCPACAHSQSSNRESRVSFGSVSSSRGSRSSSLHRYRTRSQEEEEDEENEENHIRRPRSTRGIIVHNRRSGDHSVVLPPTPYDTGIISPPKTIVNSTKVLSTFKPQRNPIEPVKQQNNHHHITNNRTPRSSSSHSQEHVSSFESSGEATFRKPKKGDGRKSRGPYNYDEVPRRRKQRSNDELHRADNPPPPQPCSKKSIRPRSSEEITGKHRHKKSSNHKRRTCSSRESMNSKIAVTSSRSYTPEEEPRAKSRHSFATLPRPRSVSLGNRLSREDSDEEEESEPKKVVGIVHVESTRRRQVVEGPSGGSVVRGRNMVAMMSSHSLIESHSASSRSEKSSSRSSRTPSVEKLRGCGSSKCKKTLPANE